MTEVTRVPIQPIAKGSLTKLWLGVILAVLAGAGLAWAAVPAGVEVKALTEGTGPSPAATDVVLINYTGKLADGTVFDEGQAVPLQLDQMIPGFSEGVVKMKKGGKYELTIPSDKGYGAEDKRNPQTGEVVIPGGSDLVFEIELLEFMSAEDYQMRMQMMQQMMQQQQQQGGAPEGAGGGAPVEAPQAPPQ
jgi:FKBP-type peptidyl-prolyl cis-trans isomerase FkpA